jgi:hypothetical protein
MATLEDLISNSKITPPLNLDVAIKTIDMDHSCMKDTDLQTFKNELLQKSIKQYNVTYKSDQKHNHPNTPILLFDNGIIFLGHEPKLFGILGDTPTWKFIFYCDVSKFLILDTELQISSKNKGKQKFYRFQCESKDSANIASSVQNYNFGLNILEINNKVREKMHNVVAKRIMERTAWHTPNEQNTIVGGRRRRTKRAKKNKRRTRRS